MTGLFQCFHSGKNIPWKFLLRCPERMFCRDSEAYECQTCPILFIHVSLRSEV